MAVLAFSSGFILWVCRDSRMRRSSLLDVEDRILESLSERMVFCLRMMAGSGERWFSFSFDDYGSRVEGQQPK